MNANLTLEANQQWRLQGELTFLTVDALLKHSKILWFDFSTVIVDFSMVTHADSAALALLLEWQRFSEKFQKKIIFRSLPTQLINLIQVSHLEHIINIQKG